MHTLTARIRNGRIEPDEPLPNEWQEGSRLAVTIAESPSEELDITGDSPEAIAAWIDYYDKLHTQLKDSTFPEQLERILADAKAEELATRDAYDRKIEGLFR